MEILGIQKTVYPTGYINQKTNSTRYYENIGTRYLKSETEKQIFFNGTVYDYHFTIHGTYNKAKVYKNENVLILLSYNTVVAKIVKNEDNTKATFEAYGYYSTTTCKHINMFIDTFLVMQHGLSKKDLINGVQLDSLEVIAWNTLNK